METLKAGRELDQLVAERVMGWSRIDSISWSEPAPSGLGYQRLETDLPCYSTDIAAAWEVVPELRRRRIHFEITCAGISDVYTVKLFHWAAFKDTFYEGPHKFEAYSDTAPEAICLAALKSVGAL